MIECVDDGGEYQVQDLVSAIRSWNYVGFATDTTRRCDSSTVLMFDVVHCTK